MKPRADQLKISVLTPSFNSEKYLERAIASVLIQDYKNWEHIIIDGGSKDSTVSILESHTHLKWISEPDKGQSDAMNKAFAKATGDIMIYLNADDALDPGLFTRVISEFRDRPGVDMVIGDLRISDGKADYIREPSPRLADILDFPKNKFPANPVSYAYRKAVQSRVGAFPTDNHYTMDYWFLLRVYLFFKVHKINFTCGTFYLDGTNKSSDFQRSRKSLLQVRSTFMKRYFYRPSVLFYIAGKLGQRLRK